MARLVLVTWCCFASLFSGVAFSAGEKSFIPKTYHIDLETSPRERWKPIVKDYVHVIPDLLEYVKEVEKDFGGSFVVKMISKAALAVAKLWTPSYLLEEIYGIADVTAEYGLTTELVFLTNLYYDFSARCTSTVVQVQPDLPPFHLRTMDWDCPAIVPSTVNVVFREGGHELFQVTTFPLFSGAFTGMTVPNVSLNYRKIVSGVGIWGLLKDLASGVTGGWPTTMLIRDVLQRGQSYETALEALASERLMAPAYFIVAGDQPNEGAIVTRNRLGEEKRMSLDSSGDCHLGKVEGKCFIVQTNIDHWVSEVDKHWADGDPLLLNSVERREKAIQYLTSALSSSGETSTIDALISMGNRVLSTQPVCNDQTNYYVVMSPGLQVLNATAVLDYNVACESSG